MRSQVIGYARVSTADQNLERQLDMLRKYGVETIFEEKMSGTRRDRPELNRMLAHKAMIWTLIGFLAMVGFLLWWDWRKANAVG